MPMDKDRAREALRMELRRREISYTRLSEMAREQGKTLDSGTVGEFIRGENDWPRETTLGVIANLLGRPVSWLDDVAYGRYVEDVGSPEQDDDIRRQRPEGISDRDWAALRRRSDATLDALFEEYSPDRDV